MLSSLNVCLFPLLYFFSFFYYTDAGSTFMVLLMYCLHLDGNDWAASFMGTTNLKDYYRYIAINSFYIIIFFRLDLRALPADQHPVGGIYCRTIRAGSTAPYHPRSHGVHVQPKARPIQSQNPGPSPRTGPWSGRASSGPEKVRGFLVTMFFFFIIKLYYFPPLDF